MISAVITKNFNPNTEVAKPIGVRINEGKAEIVTHPVAAETKISDCSV